MIAPRTRVELHGLSSAVFNGRVGVIVGPAATSGRLAVRLGVDEEKALRPQNLRVLLPTLSLPLIICGSDTAEGTELLRLVMDRREQLLLERGAYMPVHALVGREGSVCPAKRQALSHADPRPDAPHGGLSDRVLAAALARPDLSECQGFQASAASARASHRRLGPALRAVAAPSMVVADMSEGAVGARLLVTGDFRLERYGGACVALSTNPDEAPATDEPAWLRRERRASAAASSAEAVLAAVLEAFTGWLPLLVSPPASLRFKTCLWCRKPPRAPEQALVCAGCHAVSYCSAECQHNERIDTERGGLCHAAYCAAPHGFGASMKVDVAVALPTAPAWLEAAFRHEGRLGDECALLQRMGCHRPPYTYFCRCVPDGELFEDGGVSMCSELLAALPPPPRTSIAEDGHSGGRVLAPPQPLASWAEYYVWRQVAPESPVALLLTFTMTIYHCIVLSGQLPEGLSDGARGEPSADVAADGRASTDAPGQADEAMLTVHCIGPATREFGLLGTFAELAHVLPSMRVRLCMVGPAAPVEAAQAPPARFDGGAGGWLEVTWHRCDYLENEGLPPPDLAVACNSGVFEYETWQPTIGHLYDLGVPFYFSDYSEGGLLAASIAIRETHGVALGTPPSLPPRLNPFRQPLDRRLILDGFSSFAIPWMSNGYLAALVPGER